LDIERKQLKIALYGGSFDPVHRAHLAIARELTVQFRFDEFVFIPAFHAPHKKRLEPTSAFDRFAMLMLATSNEPNFSVSKIEIEVPHKPYTVETLTRLNELLPDARLYFVMGADSWKDIRTWREWEKVLTLTNHIVVTRPGVSISFDHVTDEIRDRVVDTRVIEDAAVDHDEMKIYITDAVDMDISATLIREKIRTNIDGWKDEVPKEVAKYIEKYQIYS
jgi:nicotinate-nucleotide adenylyltransferase